MSEPLYLTKRIDELLPWDKNPRTINDAAMARLVSSIQEFGLTQPIVWNKRSGRIVAGHQRLEACKILGWDEVPVAVVAFDDTTEKLANLAHNAAYGQWEEELLSDVLRDLMHAGADLDLSSLEPWLMEEILQDEEDDLDLEDGDENASRADEVSDPLDTKKPTVELISGSIAADSISSGDIFQLGRHRLICGDSRDPLVVDALMDEATIDLAFTSPPYADQREYDKDSGFTPIKSVDYVEWYKPVSANVARYLDPRGSYFINIKEHVRDGVRDLYVKDLVLTHSKQWGWNYVDELCWVKTIAVPISTHGRFKNGWEPLFHFVHGKTSEIFFNPDAVSHESDAVPVGKFKRRLGDHGNVSIEKETGPGMARPSNVLTITPNQESVQHSAAFPVELPAFFIRAFSRHDSAVYDPFMGSGTTLLASEQEGRTAYGCEISPQYCAEDHTPFGGARRSKSYQDSCRGESRMKYLSTLIYIAIYTYFLLNQHSHLIIPFFWVLLIANLFCLGLYVGLDSITKAKVKGVK